MKVFIGMILVFCFIVFYFIPGLIAACRDCKSKSWILMINLFFGWSGLAWVACLIWAICGEKEVKKPVYFSRGSKGWGED